MKIKSLIYTVLLLLLQISLLMNCKKEPHNAPSLTIAPVTNIASTTATCGGTFINGGSAIVVSRGVCWSVTDNPTTADAKTSNGGGIGNFVSNINGLTPGTTYNIKAYGTNAIGTGYSSQSTFKTLALAPVLTTAVLSDVTSSTAICGGNITNDGGSPVATRGVCWGTLQNPTIANSKTIDGAGSGGYTSSIVGLSPGTTYYIRAYATNSIGTSYGNQITTTTTAILPELTTTAISAITTTTATSGGNITSDGGKSVTSRGVCWSTAASPTIVNSKTTDGSAVGSFISSITALNPGGTYYIRAYATNSVGTAYGNQLTVTTTAILPFITTASLTAILSTSATSGGNITNDGGSPVIARGICWGTSQIPTTANSKTIDGLGSGSFTSYITGLAPLTTYYLRAYATNIIGTAYGNQLTATTTANLPVLTTAGVSAIASISATSGGNVTNDGGSPVTARGVCWNIAQNPTTTNAKTTDGTGIGSFTSSISGLTPGVTYYIRAYATNSAGTAYGNQLTATTTANLPMLTTTGVSAITSNRATSGGYISSDGGVEVTVRGVCWNTAQNPTIANSKTTDGTGAGSFTSSISGLTLGTTYYIRSYATNSVGTAYGNQLSFATLNIPSYVPAIGLVAWWPFAGNANDESGNGNNGIIYNTTLTADRFGNSNSSYTFSGVSSRIEAPANTKFDFQSLTISLWIYRLSGAGAGKIVSKSNWTNSSNESFSFWVDNSYISIDFKKNSSCISGSGWKSFPIIKPVSFDNSWKHLLVTYDGTTIKYYINGLLSSSFAFQGPIDVCSGGQIRFGAWWNSFPDYFKGRLDDIGIWNRALTQQEITNLYNSL